MIKLITSYLASEKHFSFWKREFFLGAVSILVYVISFLLIVGFSYVFFVFNYDIRNLWEIANFYTTLILSSWPAAILILGLVLFLTQKNSIGEFISKRMVSIGPDGVKGETSQEKEVLLSKQEFPKEDLDTVVDSAQSENPEQVEVLLEQVSSLQKALGFERIYNVIFGTQLSILSFLRKNKPSGLWHNALISTYDKWKEDDELLKKYSIDDYINFLLNNQLMERVVETGNDPVRYVITQNGEEFLDHIEQNSYSLSKPH